MVANETPFTTREKEAILTQFPSLGLPRDPESHKGTHGSIGVLGGGSGMTGAPILASMAALKLGAGKVFIGFNQDTLPMPYIASMPELMLYTAKELIVEFRDSMNAWIVGPGLSQCAEARRILQDRKSTRLNSSHVSSSYAAFRFQKKRAHATSLNPRNQNSE